MAHELLIENGKAAMFYVDTPPWHNLGTQLKTTPSSEEAIRFARLDWRVAKVPLYVAGGTRLHEVHDRFALVREDTLGKPDCSVFGIAGRDYVPLQNAEAFEFFDPIVKEGDAVYETAGALGKGERVWVLARLCGEMQVAEGDDIRRYLLLSNSHDGTSSLQVKFTPAGRARRPVSAVGGREGAPSLGTPARSWPWEVSASPRTTGPDQRRGPAHPPGAEHQASPSVPWCRRRIDGSRDTLLSRTAREPQRGPNKREFGLSHS